MSASEYASYYVLTKDICVRYLWLNLSFNLDDEVLPQLPVGNKLTHVNGLSCSS